MTLSELVRRVKTVPMSQGESETIKFILSVVGPDKKGDILGNRYRRALRKKVSEL